MAISTPFQGLLLIIAYAVAITWTIQRLAGKVESTKFAFLLAKRDIPGIPAAFSIADAWIWAPAFFLSAEKAYTQGWVGLFWFLFGNIMCPLVFALFVLRIIRMLPGGYTGPHFMRERYSLRVHTVYLAAFGLLTTCSFAVQLLMAGKLFASIFDIPHWQTTVILACIPIVYTIWGGMRGSVMSDLVQLSIVFAIGAIVIPWVIFSAGGWSVVGNGLNGVTGTFTSLWEGDGLNVFWTFGFAATINLAAGALADQSFWQRGFATRERDVRAAFLAAPWIFAIVPLGMGLLGFAAAGIGLGTGEIPNADTSQVSIAIVLKYLPIVGVWAFAIMVLAGLLSKLDTNLTSISSLAGHDIASRLGVTDDRTSLIYGRAAMVVLILCGIGIANIPGIKLEYLFLFYGMLRTATFLPTIITLVKKQVSEAGMFWGVLTSLTIGVPSFAYGVTNEILWLSISATVFTALASGIIVLLASARSRAYALKRA